MREPGSGLPTVERQGLAMTFRAVLLGLLVVLCAVTAIEVNSIWPLDKELIYEYTAKVHTGTVDPAKFISQYIINGKLHIQAHGDAALIKFTDVKYKLYNGAAKDNDDSKSQFLSIPEDASEITTPFRIQYKEGKVKKLFVKETDALWSQNMKKAIASILQLDTTRGVERYKHSAFFGDEDSIYGSCGVIFSFTPDLKNEDTFGIITKTIDPSTCKGFPSRLWSNTESVKCDTREPEERLTLLSKREYHIKKTAQGNSSFTPIAYISSHSSISHKPFRGFSDLHYTTVNQTLKLVSVADVAEPITVDKELEIQNLRYTLPKSNPLGIAMDHSLGRNKYNSDLKATTLTLLDDILDYTEENHVDPEEPNWNRSALISRVMYEAMDYMGVDLLNTVYTELSQSTVARDHAKRDLFVKLLPLVGTQASAITVRNLIRKSKVKPYEAISMLTSLPVNIRNPTEKLLDEMESLIHLPEEQPKEVRNAAVLSFATLVYKTCKGNTNAEFLNRTVDRVADIYVKRLVDGNNDFGTHMLYLSGLSNMRVGRAALILKGIVQESVLRNHHLHHLALWASSPVGTSDFETAYSLYWPSLGDKNAHLECRVAALQLLMHSASTTNHFIQLHWIMLKERHNHHLYNMYYSILKAYAASTCPCVGMKSQIAAKILRLTRPPTVDTLTEFSLSDYANEVYGFGALLRTTTVADPETGLPYIVKFSMASTAMNYKTEGLTVYIKAEGLDGITEAITDNNVHGNVDPANAAASVLDKAEHFTNNSSDKEHSKPLHIEIIILSNGRIVSTTYINETTVKNLMKTGIKAQIRTFIDSLESFNVQRIALAGAMDLHIPTDLGVPAVLESEVPAFFSASGKLDLEDGFKFVSILRLWTHRYYTLSVINPVTGAWHGLIKASEYIVQLPISFGIKEEGRKFKFIFGHQEGLQQRNTTFGEKFYTKMVTFIYDEINNEEKSYLEHSCPTCHDIADVISDPAHLKQVYLDRTHLAGFGHITDVRIFDCDRDISSSSIKSFWSRLWDEDHMNDNGDVFTKLYLAALHFKMYNILSPAPGQCGLLMRLVPDPEIPGPIHLEATVVFIPGQNSSDHHLVQGLNVNVNGKIALKDGHNHTHSLVDLSTHISSSAGNIHNLFKAQLTVIKEGKPQAKVCADFSQTFPERTGDVQDVGWGDEKINNHFHLSVGKIYSENLDECPTNGSSITIEGVAEKSKEQKDLASSDVYPYNQCAVDKTKSEWKGALTPRSWACFQSMRDLTTLRKYTYKITHENLPQSLLDLFHAVPIRSTKLSTHYSSGRGGPLSGDEYSAPNTAYVQVEYSAIEPLMDIAVRTPASHSLFSEVPVSSDWLILDNTHLSQYYLFLLDAGLSKSCIVNRENVYTGDNATIAHGLTNAYQLLAGHKSNLTLFSAYVKKEDGEKPLVLKLVNMGVELFISHDKVTLDGMVLTNLENGYQYPEDDFMYDYRIWKTNGRILVFSRTLLFFVEFTGHSIIIEQPFYFQVKATGLCGNLNGDPLDDVPSAH